MLSVSLINRVALYFRISGTQTRRVGMLQEFSEAFSLKVLVRDR